MAITVLIVDDHPSFRATARMLLESEGYTVVGEAPDGMTAIAQAGALTPEVVLLDINLPDLDGFEVADRLRDPPSQIVLISSRDAADYGTCIEGSGARGFIAKGELSGLALKEVLAG
jgi:DNA-binding NarL/FixJ family response regulator